MPSGTAQSNHRGGGDPPPAGEQAHQPPGGSVAAPAARLTQHCSSPRSSLRRPDVIAALAVCWSWRELAAICYTERVNVTLADQELLCNVQRSTIDWWVRLLTATRLSLTPGQARVLVHAAMALVVDLGRLVHCKWLLCYSALANCAADKISGVTDQADDCQAAGLRIGEAQPEHRLDSAVGVDVAPSAARE
ncbi:hypothetical protein [Mycobacterium xenopi]|uniref:hypothetical protein n=1 Tax=Mycobacterium xenopi TaxID=1789 RepID=UPI001C49C423